MTKRILILVLISTANISIAFPAQPIAECEAAAKAGNCKPPQPPGSENPPNPEELKQAKKCVYRSAKKLQHKDCLSKIKEARKQHKGFGRRGEE